MIQSWDFAPKYPKLHTLHHIDMVLPECCKVDNVSQWQSHHPKMPESMVTKICMEDYMGYLSH